MDANVSDVIKKSIKHSITKYTNIKLKENNISREEFDKKLTPLLVPFFDQVQSYTNNFEFLITPEIKHAEKNMYGKFVSYDNYLLFNTLQSAVKNKMELQRCTELQAINNLLNSKTVNIDLNPAYIRILNARKEKLMEKTESR